MVQSCIYGVVRRWLKLQTMIRDDHAHTEQGIADANECLAAVGAVTSCEHFAPILSRADKCLELASQLR